MQAIFQRLQRLPSWAHFVLTGFVGMVFGILLITGWYHEDKLMQPLIVEIINLRPEVVANLVIEHSNDKVQEKIMVTQIRPKEVRVIALNHQPGLGYSVKTRLDGEDLDVCVGKTSKQWLNQIFLKKEGISSRD